MQHRFVTLAAIVAAGLSLGALTLIAGPLDPPNGPVQSTYKTLTEVEPRIAVNAANTPGDADALYVISQPGSYYLTGNISGAAGKHGIQITASDVTLDLGGFVLTGANGTLDGVACDALREGVVVRNGSVRKWENGVRLVSSGGRVERICAMGNRGTGIDLTGSPASHVISCEARGNTGLAGISAGANAVLRDCMSTGNLLLGFAIAERSEVIGCNASDNGDAGFFGASGSSFEGCVSSQNAGGFFGLDALTFSGCVAEGSDLQGFFLGSGAAMRGCVARSNGREGIFAGAGAALTGCTAQENASDGISLMEGSSATDCTATSNQGAGIRALSGAMLQGCAASSNVSDGMTLGEGAGVSDCVASRNGGSGIVASHGATLRGCTGSYNGAHGVSVADGSTVAECTGLGNSAGSGVKATIGCCVTACAGRGNFRGVHVDSRSSVIGCTASNNTAGVYAVLSDNRIEGNNVTLNQFGIDVDGAGNVVVRNSASGNSTNYAIAGGNDVGPIGSASTATSPWANIAF